MKIDAAKGRSFRIHRTNAAQQLKGIGSRSDGPVIAPVPHLDAVEFVLMEPIRLMLPAGGCAKTAIPPAWCIPSTNSSIVEKRTRCRMPYPRMWMVPPLRANSSPGMTRKELVRECFAQLERILPFGDRRILRHDRLLQRSSCRPTGNFNDAFKRFVSIGKPCVDVKHSLCRQDLSKHLLSCDLEHLFDFGGLDRSLLLDDFRPTNAR